MWYIHSILCLINKQIVYVNVQLMIDYIQLHTYKINT